MTVINFENVAKIYKVRDGQKIILKNFTGTLPHRNIGVLAANGVGKSTLMRLIARTEPPSSGRIESDGRISWPLGFSGSFNGSLTGAENCRFVARIYGENVRRVQAFVAEFSELGDFFHMPFSTYSSGMRSRLAFGVSMAVQFDCYLVDEITEVGDTRFRERCRSYFKEKLQKANIIMVSHGLPTLRSYCDMGVVLHDGELLIFDDLEEAIVIHEKILQRRAAQLDTAQIM